MCSINSAGLEPGKGFSGARLDIKFQKPEVTAPAQAAGANSKKDE
jgi:hypothetical protein